MTIQSSYSLQSPAGDPFFAAFMRQVDREIGHLAGGLSSDDLVDYQYDVAYEDGRSPRATARDALRNEFHPSRS